MAVIVNLTAGNFSHQKPSQFSDIAPFDFPRVITIWTYCTIAVIFTAIWLDLEILYVFHRNRRLVTPFTIHVINMTLINLITAAVYDPIVLRRNLDREIFRGNRPLCAVYKYLQWTTLSMMALQHCIICLDRWLALLKPTWYRTRTRAFGMKATTAAWIYQQVWYLPLFTIDLREWTDPKRLCEFTQALPVYQHTARFMTIFLPQIIPYVSYPFLLFRLWKRTRPRLPAPEELRSFGHRRSRATTELRLVACLVALQIILWTPFNVCSILSSLRTSLPSFVDVTVMSLLIEMILLLVDPLAYLAFLGPLRREVRVHLGGFRRNRRVAADGSQHVELSTRNSMKSHTN